MDEMTTRLAAVVRRHGFEHARDVATVVPNPLCPGGVLLKEIRHASRFPIDRIVEMEDCLIGKMPTPLLLDVVDRLASEKRRLIRRDEAMDDAGHDRLTTPAWAVRAHRVGLMLIDNARSAKSTIGASEPVDTLNSDLLRMDEDEIDPLSPTGDSNGWQLERIRYDARDGDLDVDLRLQGDLVLFSPLMLRAADTGVMTVLLSCDADRTVLSLHGDYPESIMPSLVGRDVAQVVSHPAWGRETGVKVIEAEMDRDDRTWLDLTIENTCDWLADVPAGIDDGWRS